MKILIVHPMISWRGAEKLSVNLALHLQEMGHSVGYVTLFTDPKNSPIGFRQLDLLMPPKIWQEFLRRSRLAFFLFGFWFLFFLTIKHSAKYQIINAHNIPAPWIAVIVGSIRKIPKVWTVFNLPEEITWKKKANISEYLLWGISRSFIDIQLVKRLDCIVSCSRHTSIEIKKRYKADSTLILYPITKAFVNSSLQKHKYSHKLNKFILVSAAHMHPAKNQMILLKAFPYLLPEIKNVELILAGDGPFKEKYQAFANKLKISQNVFFPGVLTEKEMVKLYKRAHLLLVPSLDEPFGLTPFEALGCGTIPLVSASSGASGVISDERLGYIAKPNSKAFGENIIKIYRNKSSANKIAERGRKWVRKNMTYNRYAREHEKLFQKTLYK